MAVKTKHCSESARLSETNAGCAWPSLFSGLSWPLFLLHPRILGPQRVCIHPTDVSAFTSCWDRDKDTPARAACTSPPGRAAPARGPASCTPCSQNSAGGSNNLSKPQKPGFQPPTLSCLLSSDASTYLVVIILIPYTATFVFNTHILH